MLPDPFRPEPRMPAHAYTTYALIRPPTPQYWRTATCAEVDCEHWRNGWVTRIDTSTDMGVRQANYIGNQSGRAYTARLENTLAVFTFPAGQQCFAEHRVPHQREPLYVVRGGDHRGNPRGEKRTHTRGEFWVEDMQERLGQLTDEIERG
jgi:hypothetical protein